MDASVAVSADRGTGLERADSLTKPAIQLVPVLAELGWWGLRHRPTSEPLRVRAQLLHDGGPQLWEDFMSELYQHHLGIPAPATGRPSVHDQLDAAYAEAIGAGAADEHSGRAGHTACVDAGH